MRNVLLALGLATGLAGGPAMAQQQNDAEFVAAFSGQWFSFDPARGDGDTCAVTLNENAANGIQVARTQSCADPLSTASGWKIENGQIKLLGAGQDIAALGGNQFRITGQTADGTPLVLERATGDANSRAIREAISTHRCIYKGFTDECATQEDLATDADASQILTLVNLNVRQQPRSDAELIGTISRNAAIEVDTCLVASDGLWCSALFGKQTGWFPRTAIRSGEWPVLTFIEATL